MKYVDVRTILVLMPVLGAVFSSPVAHAESYSILKGGKPVWTERDLKMLAEVLPPDVRSDAIRNPKAFAELLMRNQSLADYARSKKMESNDRVRRQITWFENGVLAQSVQKSLFEDMKANPSEIRSFLQGHSKDYIDFVFRVEIIPYKVQGRKNIYAKAYDALSIAKDIRAKISGGQKLDQASAPYSDVVIVEKADEPTENIGANLPANVRDAVFALKAGTVSQPLRVHEGWALIQLVESHPLPDSVMNELASARIREERAKKQIEEIVASSGLSVATCLAK